MHYYPLHGFLHQSLAAELKSLERWIIKMQSTDQRIRSDKLPEIS